MELPQLFSFFTSTTLFFLITSIIFLRSFINFKTKSYKSRKLPPGPWKLPIIGSMHHMVGNGLPHEILSRLSKKYGSIMHLQLGEISAVVLSSPEMAKLVLKTHDLSFVDRPGTKAIDIITYNKTSIGFSPYGDYWRQMRKICVLELLSAKRVKSYQSIRENEVANMIALIRKSEGSPINMSDQFFRMSNSIVSTTVFGENINSQNALIDASTVDEVLALTGGFNLDDFFPSLRFLAYISGAKTKLEKVFKKLDTMIHEVIEKHRLYSAAVAKESKEATKKEDMLDTLLRLQKQNEEKVPITDNNVKAVALDMFIAGSESSASIIEWAMSELIRNPEIMEKVQAEVKESIEGNKNIDEGFRYLKYVIKETLRIHTPGPLLVPRECREACEINGYHIPLKTKIIVNAWAIARDPDIWKDAEKFIPERFEKNMFEFNGDNFEFLPFGSGRRMCPGMAYGIATVELALIQLLYHFTWKLPNNAKGNSLDMTVSAGISNKRRTPIHLVATARS